MGTRNLTMVIQNQQTKVAQYGQWDGYPEGQGKTILSFLKAVNMEEFRRKISELRWLTDQESAMINADDKWIEKYGYLSRDLGGNILNAIQYGKWERDGINGKQEYNYGNILGLSNEEEFAKDSLSCEWAYVIDLDNNILECYKGFNKSPVPADARFQGGPDKSGYYPVTLIKSYKLDSLPEYETFISDLSPVEARYSNVL